MNDRRRFPIRFKSAGAWVGLRRSFAISQSLAFLLAADGNILAAVAEHEREAIAARTKVALQAAKARGVRLGRHGADYLAKANKNAALERATRLKPIITELTAARMSIRQIAMELTARGIAPPRGGSWHPETVARIVRRTTIL